MVRFVLTSFLSFLCAILCGVFLGVMAAMTENVKNVENLSEFENALPTRVYDINGELVTEFSSDEKREMISLAELPQHLIDALLAREDSNFFKHRGFSVKAIVRAFIGLATGKSLGGGSTLTQQIAGTLYADRSSATIRRKIVELWWAIQMERRYSKNEILELYLNKIYFGGGTYGVSAASKYYFGHPAAELTSAESAILVIQLSNPAFYNPFDYPNRAKERQRDVLDKMVELGSISKAEADESFVKFWDDFDYTRTNMSAFYQRDDKAAWFSEYVLRELSSLFYGNMDVYTGGYSVQTTLNLKHQKAAESILSERIEFANKVYQKDTSRVSRITKKYVPMVEMLSLLCSFPQLKQGKARNENKISADFNETVNPVLDIMAMMTGQDNLKTQLVGAVNEKLKEDSAKTVIEGTMIAIEPETGYITALVGGSKFDPDNQFIRAVQAKVQPGSTFKPLYYSAAIDSRKFTAASMIYDSPVVFYNENGLPYYPTNFLNEWTGSVLLWYALAKSMNVPSLKILDGIGFDLAFNRAALLLGIPQSEMAERKIEHLYPVGLGTCDVRPIEVARAYAIFANQGRDVTPIAIRNVQDRKGMTILDPEHEIRVKQRQKGSEMQVISPQTAFIMTDILKNSVTMGTLRKGFDYGAKLTYTDANGKKRTVPSAGKSGTTQNWSSSWAVGYTPNIAAAFWFGFDKPGESFGLELTGSTLAAPPLGDFMRVANEDYPEKNFVRPATGLSRVEVCSVSGLLPTPACGKHRTLQYFLKGTVPTEECELHANLNEARNAAVGRLATAEMMLKKNDADDDVAGLAVDLSFLDEFTQDSINGENRPAATGDPDVNPFMDDGETTEEGNFLFE